MAFFRFPVLASLLLMATTYLPAEPDGERPASATSPADRETPAESAPERTALDDYVARPDASYRWELVDSSDLGPALAHSIDLRSQSWRSPSEVDRVEWQHWLTVVVPKARVPETALLLIGGGSNKSDTPPRPDDRVLALAKGTSAVVCELRMVPNQALVFSSDPEERPRVEDDLIAHAWNQYMDTGDATWLPRFPMVKSAVRAMDCVQEFLASEKGGKRKVEEFVVAGGSKRGWTTWLVGAVDRRVSSIVPIVIDVLNVLPSMEHHFAAYGFWAPAVGDYERNGIMDRRFDPRYDDLLRLVDPFAYRHRLRMPKLILNASGDQFFLPDSSRFYFEQLEGEKYLRYVPNADHSLRGSDAVETIAAWFLAIAHDKERPQLSWTFPGEDAIAVRCTKGRPKEVKLWEAYNPEARDFRVETLGEAYTSRSLELDAEGAVTARVEVPETGFRAFFVELRYDIGAPMPLKLTTAVRVVPDVLPYQAKLEERNRELQARAKDRAAVEDSK